MPNRGDDVKIAPRVQIIDYKLGNLFSIQQACHQAGLNPFVSADPDKLRHADGIILPGVGAFGNAMDSLRKLSFVDALNDVVLAGKPLMGICLGMQLLFDESEEFGNHAGLQFLSGKIRKLPGQVENGRRLRVPNVGWNRIHPDVNVADHHILSGIPDGAFMYFVHSYYADPANSADQLLTTDYGSICYCCGAQRDNILGLQFHPEKSGPCGLRFYENWARSI